MVKFLIFIVFIIIFFAMWNILCKIRINRAFKRSYYKKLSLVKSPLTKEVTTSTEEIIGEVDAYEQQLFDDVAQLLFDAKKHEILKEQATFIQEDVLKKMPIQTQTNIRNLDLEEWSIYWGFYHQSLEYYVGRYGVFITHVDRNGKEHQYSYRIQD